MLYSFHEIAISFNFKSYIYILCFFNNKLFEGLKYYTLIYFVNFLNNFEKNFISLYLARQLVF